MTDQRLNLSERKLELAREIDTLLEIAMRTRASLEQMAPNALQLLVNAVGADGAALVTNDESGEARLYHVGEELDILDLESQVEESGECRAEREGKSVVGYRLDVTDAYLGSAFVWGTLGEVDDVAELLEIWSEQFDNFVGSKAEARRKQAAITAISDALKAPILEQGLVDAMQAYRQHAPFDDLILACRSEATASGPPSSYVIVIDGQIRFTSDKRPDARVEALLTNALEQLLTTDRQLDESALQEIGWGSPHRVDLPILGLDGTKIVGRLIAGFRSGEPTPFVKDLSDLFADYLRQRVVDFSREWRHLSRHFSRDVVERLLREPSYFDRYLAPREANAAIVFADISGFTRVSEQVLKEPQKIAHLIDVWSRRVVDIVWETGGVFDKMVGDCVIAMWGPPFYERTSRETCLAAIEAARRIRDWTSKVGGELGLRELRQTDPLGVAVGIHHAPLFVGCIGAGEDFTGFSSGMNNAARLQGLASRNEILCMESVVAEVEGEAGFGDLRSEVAKNVEEPLVFRPLAS